MIAVLEEPVRGKTDPDRSAQRVSSSSLAAALKMLSDVTRLRIVRMLARDGEMNVNNICEQLGQSQPLISHHLALLRVAKLIDVQRDGKFNFYHVRSHELHSLVDQFSELFVPAETDR